MESNNIGVPSGHKYYKIPQFRMGKEVLEDSYLSVFNEKPFPRDRIIIGVMGSAGKEFDKNGREYVPTEDDKKMGDTIGRVVASNGCILLNGATWGIPYFAARGANRNRGYTIGISPFEDLETHIKYNPFKHLDLIWYVGAAYKENPRYDFISRDGKNTNYPDIIISAGGRWGTLDECTHALEQGLIYVPVKGSHGATEGLILIIENRIIEKDNGALIIIPDKDKLDYDPQNKTVIYTATLEDAIARAIDEAKRRWQVEGRTENRFVHIVDKLEEVMGIR